MVIICRPAGCLPRRPGWCGTDIVGLALEIARQMEMAKVLITCDDDNIGSARIIEKNGGVFENTYWESMLRTAKKRYWIEL